MRNIAAWTSQLQWTDEGVVCHPHGGIRFNVGFGDPFNTGHSPSPLETTNPHAVVVRWSELVELEAIDPWPALRVAWLYNRQRGEINLRPGSLTSRTEFDVAVQRLFAVAGQHVKPHHLKRGWLDAQFVPWERVADFPGQAASMAGHGAYRSSGATVEERVIARRTAPSPFEVLLNFISSGPDHPFKHHPREIRVTERYLYAQRGAGRAVWRLPLGELRAQLSADMSNRYHLQNAIFLFGRHTALVLVREGPCEVRNALEHLLSLRHSGGFPPRTGWSHAIPKAPAGGSGTTR